MMRAGEITDYAKKNKVAAMLALIVVVIFLALAFSLASTLQRSAGRMSSDYETSGSAPSALQESLYMKQGAGNYNSVAGSGEQTSGSYVEVKEGSMTIETKNAENDASQIRSLAESSGGYVENMHKYDDSYSLNINIRIRVSESGFQNFVDALKAKYDTKDYTLSFYRLSTQRETDELDVLNAAMNNYEQLRNRTMMIALDENQINLLFKITEKEIEINRLEKQYTTSLAGKHQRSDLATLNIALQEKKEVSIMPENLGNQLRLKAKNALEDVSNSLMDILAGSVAVFVSAIKYVIYIILFAIPLLFGYRILKFVYSRIFK